MLLHTLYNALIIDALRCSLTARTQAALPTNTFTDYIVDPTYAVHTVVRATEWQSLTATAAGTAVYSMDSDRCSIALPLEEGPRVREQASSTSCTF
jgi:hypothetical protein